MKARARLTTHVFVLAFALGLALALAIGARAETALVRATAAGALCGSAAGLSSRLVPVQAPAVRAKDHAA